MSDKLERRERTTTCGESQCDVASCDASLIATPGAMWQIARTMFFPCVAPLTTSRQVSPATHDSTLHRKEAGFDTRKHAAIRLPVQSDPPHRSTLFERRANATVPFSIGQSLASLLHSMPSQRCDTVELGAETTDGRHLRILAADFRKVRVFEPRKKTRENSAHQFQCEVREDATHRFVFKCLI